MKKNNLIKTERITKELKKFERNVNKMGYAPNTARLYRWQASMFLEEAMEKITPDNSDRIAFQYLKKLQKKKSRTYLLQACSAVDIVVRQLIGRPLAKETLRKVQELK